MKRVKIRKIDIKNFMFIMDMEEGYNYEIFYQKAICADFYHAYGGHNTAVLVGKYTIFG